MIIEELIIHGQIFFTQWHHNEDINSKKANYTIFNEPPY